MKRWLSRLALVAAVLAVVALPRHIAAQSPPAASASASASVSAVPTGSASVAPAPEPPKPVSPKVQLLRDTIAKIRDLMAKKLDVAVEPATLFDIDIADASAVAVEARRLAAVIERARRDEREASEPAPAPPPVSSSSAAPSALPKTPPPRPRPATSASASASVAPEPPPPPDPATAAYEALRKTDQMLWAARVELDEARLSFYRLSADERAALLTAHAERQKADLSTKTEKTIAEADRDAEKAEKEKQEALEAAKQAHSEAERAVHEEHARLLDVTKQQAEYSKELAGRADGVQKRSDAALGERRKITEAIHRQTQGPRDEAAMDLLYGALRKRLKEARANLGEAIDLVASDESGVPVAGPDPLSGLLTEIDLSKVVAERQQIDKTATELQKREQTLRQERARLLMAEVELLNRARLQMLPFLSSVKRGDVTGFGPEGFDQARSEVTQVWLTVRYHLHATELWVQAVRSGDERGSSAWAGTLILLKWLVPIFFFISWRRRADDLLKNWRKSAREMQKKERRDARGPATLVRALSFALRVRKPLEWLLLLWAVLWLLPGSMRELLEVELIDTIFSWTLGGALVVDTIDALSSDDVRGPRRAPSATITAHLRLRSLRVVGRAVVTVGLILSLSDKLVGKGTIFSWVLSTCWFAAIPILLFIVSWWRPVIFERVELIRKKGRFEKWVLANVDGATSFIAAIAGGAFLFATGTWRIVRGWVVTFNFTRRVLAYLFRRGMSKKASEGEKMAYEPIAAETFKVLGPETASDKIVPSVADEQVTEVITRIDAPGGGIFAIVGERGAGKTTLANRIQQNAETVAKVVCPTGGLEPFRLALNAALGLPPETDIETAGRAQDATGLDTAIIIDDAQHLILPMMDGLKDFDAVLELARSNSKECTWVFTIDDVLWRFLERLRGARPLFDDVIHLQPWTEEGIVGLLTHRSEVAEVEPVFDGLLEELPVDADEIDRMEALQRTEANYYRLLWDYAGGNPGVALHFWRKSLGVTQDGTTHVRLFTAPDAEDLQGLPDATVFVLRAVVQLGWGSFDQICDATALHPSQVKDALRYGSVKGYFEREEDRYHVTWAWFRAITRFLRRRHLLFSH